MNWIRGWMALVVLALFFLVCAAQADAEAIAEPDAVEQVDLWTAIAPQLAPRRIQVLNLMVQRQLERNGFDVPELPAWGATTTEGWNQHLPQLAVAYADVRGAVLSPEWIEIGNESWPPMIDTVRILIHENLHQLQAVPGGSYGVWGHRQRAIEEGRVEAASIVLADAFMRRHWPHARFLPMGEAYPSCVRVIQVTAARATATKLSTRTARSFLLWMMRTDIDTAVSIAYEHGLHEDLAACEAETTHSKENNNA